MNQEVPIRPAATVALLRDSSHGPEVFLLRRNSKHVFAARAYVYPGGAVEAVDSDEAVLARYCNGDAASANAALDLEGALRYWSTAVRECFEEAGVLVGCRAINPLSAEALSAARDELNAGVLDWRHLVDRLDLQLDASAMCYFDHWTTPRGMPRRFSTRFFVARMPDAQQADPDGSETTRGEWLRPDVALERHAAGEIELMIPTVSTLRRIGEYGDTRQALAGLAIRESGAP